MTTLMTIILIILGVLFVVSLWPLFILAGIFGWWTVIVVFILELSVAIYAVTQLSGKTRLLIMLLLLVLNIGIAIFEIYLVAKTYDGIDSPRSTPIIEKNETIDGTKSHEK